MATTITKLFPTGVLRSLPEFDEVTYSSIKASPDGVYAAEFDEVSNPTINTYGSAEFNGSTQSLSFNESAVFRNALSGDWTIEFWWRPTIDTTSNVLDFYEAATNYRFLLGSNTSDVTGKLEVYNKSYSLNGKVITGPDLSTLLNKWNHIALTRINYVITLWVNGTDSYIYSGTAFAIGQTSLSLRIMGDAVTGISNGSGNLTNLRIVTGNIGAGGAIYTAPFTPPTRPLSAISGAGLSTPLLLLMPTSESLLNESGKSLINNGGVTWSSMSPTLSIPERKTGTGIYQVSGEFDEYTLNLPVPVNGSALFVRASSQYLNQTVGQYSSIQYTFECWFRQNSSSGVQGLINTRTSSNSQGTTNSGFDVAISGGKIIVTSGTSGVTVVLTGGTVNTDTWYHLAVVRNSNSVSTVYLNGISIGTFTRGSSITTALYIGVRRIASSEFFDGYISNFRFVRNYVLYTGNFTPPSTPLTAITGTALLLNTLYGAATNFLEDSSSNKYAVTNNNGVTGAGISPF